MRPRTSIVPRKGTERWLYETLRHLQQGVDQSALGLQAIVRGEVPDGSGTPLPNPDLTGYFKLIGRADDQIGYGSIDAAGVLALGSTSNAAKGFIHLGWPNARLSVDEVTKLVGINKTTPASTLHIVGSDLGSGGSGVTILPNGDINGLPATGTGWRARSGSTAVPTGGSLWGALSIDNDLTEYASINVSDDGINPQKCTLDGTIVPGSTYVVTAKISTIYATPIYGGGNTNVFTVWLVDSAGNRWLCNEAAGAFTEITAFDTFVTITRTVVCSGSVVSTGETANSIWIQARAQISNSGGGDLYFACSYLAIVQQGSTLLRWDLASGSQSGGVDYYGRLGVGTGSSRPAAEVEIAPDAAGTVGLKITALSSQTADLLDIASAVSGAATFNIDNKAMLLASIRSDSALVDVTDRTKQVTLDMSGIDTATTRANKFPNQAGTIQIGGFALTTSDTCANTTTETDITNAGGQGSLAMNAVPTGRSIRITAHGVIGNIANDSIRLRLKHGSTVVLDTGAFTLGSATTDWRFSVVLTWRSATTVIGGGIVEVQDTVTGVEYLLPFTTGDSAVTVSATGAISLTAEWGGAGAPSSSDTITTTNFIVETIY